MDKYAFTLYTFYSMCSMYIVHCQEYVSLKTSGDNGKDIISELLEEGLLRFEKNRRCFPKLVKHCVYS